MFVGWLMVEKSNRAAHYGGVSSKNRALRRNKTTSVASHTPQTVVGCSWRSNS